MAPRVRQRAGSNRPGSRSRPRRRGNGTPFPPRCSPPRATSPNRARGGATAERATPWRLLRPAAFVAAAAVALHVVATAGEWVAGSLRASRDRAAWVELARDAGVRADAAVSTPDAARAALAQRHAAARHARGLPAPDDAGPLLARAAPALATLPAGTLRRATYASGAWTLELAPLDAAALGALDARLRAAGAPALAASSAAGVRLRIGGS